MPHCLHYKQYIDIMCMYRMYCLTVFTPQLHCLYCLSASPASMLPLHLDLALDGAWWNEHGVGGLSPHSMRRAAAVAEKRAWCLPGSQCVLLLLMLLLPTNSYCLVVPTCSQCVLLLLLPPLMVHAAAAITSATASTYAATSLTESESQS